VLGKAAKAISLSNAHSAQLQADNQRLKYQLDQLQNKQTRKRVQVDQNERFSNAEASRLQLIEQLLKLLSHQPKRQKKLLRQQQQLVA
jgi:hypothetical protein